MPVAVFDIDDVGGALDDGVEEVDGAPTRLFELDACGFVARNGGGGDDIARLVAQGRNGDGEMDAHAVLAQAHGVIVLDAFAAPNAGEDGFELALRFRWKDDGNGFADDLAARIAKDAFGGRIPVEDDAVQVLGVDGIFGILDDGGKAGKVMLARLAEEKEPDLRA